MLHVGCCKKDSALSVCQRCGWDVRLIVNINFKRKKPARKRFDQCSQGSQGLDVAGDHPDSHLSHGQLVRFVVAVTDSHTSSFQKYCAVHSERFITTRHKIMIKISQDLIQVTDTYSPTGSVAGPQIRDQRASGPGTSGFCFCTSDTSLIDISQARKAVMWANGQKPEVNGPNACSWGYKDTLAN